MLPAELLNALSIATASPKYELLIKALVHGGLINRSYKMTSEKNGRSWLLQNINLSIFKEPENLEANYKALYNFSIAHPGKIRIPSPLLFSDGKYLFIDQNSEVWRAMEWIEGSCTIEKVENMDQAREVAETFASFTCALSKGFTASKLKSTLPFFHDLMYRYLQFEEALSQAPMERINAAATLTQEMKKRFSYCRLFEHFQNNPNDFPQRVMHHDAKISNILFEEKTGKIWGPIDLDTVMPGYFFSDLGDMVRSLAGTIDENSYDLSDMKIKADVYDQLVNSYSEIMENDWTSEEKKYKHACGLLLVYMQGLRFLSDYLNGDIYYHLNYAGQNLDRSKNQFGLLQCLEEYLDKKYQFSI